MAYEPVATNFKYRPHPDIAGAGLLVFAGSMAAAARAAQPLLCDLGNRWLPHLHHPCRVGNRRYQTVGLADADRGADPAFGTGLDLARRAMGSVGGNPLRAEQRRRADHVLLGRASRRDPPDPDRHRRDSRADRLRRRGASRCMPSTASHGPNVGTSTAPTANRGARVWRLRWLASRTESLRYVRKRQRARVIEIVVRRPHPVQALRGRSTR